MKKRIFAIAYMFIVTLVFAVMVNGVRYVSQGKIDLNQQARLKRIILTVLDVPVDESASAGELVSLFDARVSTVEVEGKTVYVSYEQDGKTPMGYAFPVSGSGFWGPILGIVAVDARAERILGLNFYRHLETPGLGGRISESWFRDQFKSLGLRSAGEGEQIFYLKRPGKAERLNDLEAITGATMTSQAVETFLNRELIDFMNKIRISPGKG